MNATLTRRPLGRVSALTAAATCLALLVATPASGQPAGPAGGGSATAATVTNVLNVWAPKYMERNGTMTLAKALDQAKNFDVIIAKPQDYKGYAPQMHSANPQLQLFAYINGTFAGSGDGTRYPDSWYIHDPAGEKVRSTLFGNYMMDPVNAGWVETRQQLCAAVIASSGYDGCGLDVLGPTPVLSAAFVTGTPIDPRTGARWTAKDWLAATTALAGSVRSSVAPHLVAGNGLSTGTAYFDPAAPTRQLLDGLDVGMAEGFVRGSGRATLDTYPSLTDWKNAVDMLVDAGASGKRIVVVAKVWNTGTQAEKDVWHKFCLASFLLGNDGNARFSFLYDITLDPATYHPWWNTQLGAPLGAYVARSDGTFSREFASGRALVNPGTTTVKVRLGGTFKTLDGRYVRYVVLGPHTGEVLTR